MNRNICVTCSHYIGGGDWNLCCDLKHEGYPWGFLCYDDTEACDRYEEDYAAKRAFRAGVAMCRKLFSAQDKTNTNRERLNKMTDEELARWLAYASEPSEDRKMLKNRAFDTREDAFLWWLREKSEEV